MQPEQPTGEGVGHADIRSFSTQVRVEICFELVVNSGKNIEAAGHATLTRPSPITLRAGHHGIPLHSALLRTADVRRTVIYPDHCRTGRWSRPKQ